MFKPYDNLPPRWKDKLDDYIRNELHNKYDRLGASDFRYSVSIIFPDDSYALFHNAFYIIDQDNNEFAIFTEHCGYHIFPFADTRLELLESKCSETGE